MTEKGFLKELIDNLQSQMNASFERLYKEIKENNDKQETEIRNITCKCTSLQIEDVQQKNDIINLKNSIDGVGKKLSTHIEDTKITKSKIIWNIIAPICLAIIISGLLVWLKLR